MLCGAGARSYHGLVPHPDRLLEGLNTPQIEAITHSGGPLLVLAGAGSGKTRVITRRIAWLAANGVPPEQVLALTFSAKAAEEMRTRAEELLEEPYEELHCSTFHAFCARLLHEEALEGGLDPFFHPVTQADRLALLMDHADKLEIRHHDLRANPAAFFAGVLARIDRLKDEMVTADEYLAWARSLAASNDDGERDQSRREVEFAELYATHDRLLDEAGAVDFGELILRAIRLLGERPAVRARVSARFRAVLVDEYQDTNFAQKELLRLVVAEHRNVVVVGDDDQSIYRFRGASRKNIYDFEETFPDAKQLRLEINYRSSQPILDAAHAVVEPSEERLPKKLKSASRAKRSASGLAPVSFWRCENERAQAQAVAAELERLVADGVDPGECAVLVRSVRNEGQLVATALEERGLPYRLIGAAAFFERAEVRDLIAWLRLLADPYDARAVVRALVRPPVELSPVDLARSTLIARRRKVDMITALEIALESPEVPPEARERIEGFLRMYRSAARAFEDMRPDLFVHRLVERIGLRKQHLFSASTESLERLVNIAKFCELASSWVRREPGRGSRDFADYVTAVAQAGLREEEATVHADAGAVRVMTMHGAKGLEFDCVYVVGVQHNRMPGSRRGGRDSVPDALLKESLPENTREAHVAEMRRLLYVAMTRARRRLVLAWPERAGSGGEEAEQKPSPFYEEARAALGASEEVRREELLGIHEDLYAAFRMMRDEVLGSVAQVGASMSELRLDAHLDAAHAVARYMELIKLASLIERRPRQEELADAIAEINQVLGQVASHEQRELYLGSSLDSLLLATEREKLRRSELISERAGSSLESYLPIRGHGLMLSATDIEVYRICPLRYKFARVYAIPREQTLPQRFGILMHQVLERYHSQLANEEATGGGEPDAYRLLTLFETGWRRLGFRDSNEERQLHEKAVTALDRYHQRFAAEESSPVWFERNFAFRIGRHLLRGRVDRVDRHPDGSYELIDYKTGRARRASELKDDIQLSLYQLGARESWRLESSRQSYYYLLDDEKVPVQPTEEDVKRIEETATEVAEGILAQEFEPKPSYAACSTCDFQLLCPAAER
jgi:superfamily I DNA/RNA helicase/CRISPR/Cas system-associated exonuclease Cas4 (RecB family)